MPKPQPLWPQGAPASLGSTPFDIPTLTPYLPEPVKATGAAMIVCPGGCYGGLATHEGEGCAVWLAQHGVAAFVLDYRLGTHGYRHPVMLWDAARAVRFVRADCAQWGIDPKRIGIMGSSAGGHLASTLLTHFDAGDPEAADPVDRVSSRPDLGVLCYPVLTMGSDTHDGSKENLLGGNPSPELVDLLSNEKQVTKETPPCFIFHTWADAGVKVENPLLFARALREQGVRFDLHIYENGEHGMGLGKHEADPSNYHPWTGDCLYWLQAQGFVRRPATD
jgi:acetyl esterase/lipase